MKGKKIQSRKNNKVLQENVIVWRCLLMITSKWNQVRLANSASAKLLLSMSGTLHEKKKEVNRNYLLQYTFSREYKTFKLMRIFREIKLFKESCMEVSANLSNAVMALPAVMDQ